MKFVIFAIQRFWFMHAYLHMQLTVLLELLAEHTRNYTKMLIEGYDSSIAIKECETIVRFLQHEIEQRYKKSGSATVSETNIDFSWPINNRYSI